jgi:hypothetical protein
VGLTDKIRNILSRADEKPLVTTIITLIVIAVCSFFIVRQCRRPTSDSVISNKCYYADEDGTHVFIDDASNVPPFTHDGKTAVRAVLFKCVDEKGNVTKPPYVQRLEKYNDKAKKEIEDALTRSKGVAALAQQYAHSDGMMIKKPGDTAWVEFKPGDTEQLKAWGNIMRPDCPKGSSVLPVSVDENAHP